MTIKSNFTKIKQRIKKSTEKIGKKPADITLVVVGKNRTIKQINEVITAGAEIIGENRAQELVWKHDILGNKVKWHFIGHLQRNKVDMIIDRVDMIQSLDNLRLAGILNKKLEKLGKKMDVLIEVNTSLEITKYGIRPDSVLGFITQIQKFKNLKVQGLMTMGMFTPVINDCRAFFQTLVNLSKQISARNLPNAQMRYLSMGMSRDFEAAIEEGSNMVRIGSSIFKQEVRSPPFF